MLTWNGSIIICLRTDQGTLGFIDSCDEIIQRYIPQILREVALKFRIKKFEERFSSAQIILEETALRFMHARRHVSDENQIVILRIDLMFIEGMAAFMDQGEDRCRDIVFVIIGRDSDIVS